MLGLLLLLLVATCAAVAGAEDNWLVGCWLLLVTIRLHRGARGIAARLYARFGGLF